MPTIFEAVVPWDATRSATPVQLHGLGCALFEGSGAEHEAQDKPWTIWPLQIHLPGTALLRATWLRDHLPPPPTVASGLIGSLRLGSVSMAATSYTARRATYAELSQSEAVSSREFTFQTPTYFGRNGRLYPFADPVMVLRSLSRRWNEFSPSELSVDTGDVDALLDALLLGHFDLRTNEWPGPQGTVRVGCVGTAIYRLLPTASPRSRLLFAALSACAEYLGAGKETTYGFGVVTSGAPTKETDADDGEWQ